MNKLHPDKTLQISCAEQLCERIQKELKAINAAAKRHKNFPAYVQALSRLFGFASRPVTESEKFFLGGFIVGQGSFNVSAKKKAASPFGMMLDPEFSITQHVNGVAHLLSALQIFRTGRIRYKSGSNATMVFRIDNRDSLLNKVVPFLEKYCQPHASQEWIARKSQYKELLLLFQTGQHKNLEGFQDKMLPIWGRLRKQILQSNSSFTSVEQAQQYVLQHVECKKKGSSETKRDLAPAGP